MKRFFATVTVITLLAASFAGCSKDKKKEKNPNGTPTVSAPNSKDDLAMDGNYVVLGGYFSNDNTNISIFISDGGWQINGVFFPQDNSEPVILSGPLTYNQGTDLVYSKDNDQVTFSFTETDMKVTVDKGTAYTGFSGTYKRSGTTVNIPESSTVSPASGSTLELLGRVAATHYILNNEATPALFLDIASSSFTNEYMINYIVTYADTFLSNEAKPVPDVSTQYLCYGFSEEELNSILLTATAGAYNTSKLSLADSEITIKDGVYYAPCRGTYAGGLATGYTDDNPEKINTQLLLEGAVAKMDGTRYDFTMTLTTSENSAIGASGIQIDSVDYDVAK